MSFWSSFTSSGSGGGTDWSGLANLAGAAVSLWGANEGKKTSKKNSKDATKTAQAQNDLAWQMFNESNRLNEPFRQTGVAANSQLSALLGLGGSQPNFIYGQAGTPIGIAGMGLNDFQSWLSQPQQSPQQSQQAAFDTFRNTPGYQFGLNEGMRSVQSGAAARGQLNSGKTLKDLMRLGTNYADQVGYRPYVSDIMQLSGRGQAMAGQQGQMGMNLASNIGANMQNASAARQQSTYASNQAWQQGLNNAAGFFGDWYGNRYGGGG